MSHINQEKWSSGRTFLLAAIGSAVGLGNIYRFPYVVGENGGGAFVLLYLGIILVFGIPLIMTELTIGRLRQAPPITSFKALSEGKRSQLLWTAAGFSAVVVPFVMLGFYFVIAGWTLNYAYGMIVGSFSDISSVGAKEIFDNLMASPETLIFWTTVSIVITAFINSQGVKAGLETASNILMPLLFFILILLVIYSCFNGGIIETYNFMFTVDFSKINMQTVLEAMGQAFFSLSVGSGTMLVYGSYLPKNISIPKMACGVAFADTLVALIAGFAVFPIIFANGLELTSGPGLVFETLPVIFNQMPLGRVFGVLFFLLLSFAAVTSTISLFEPAVSNLEERGIFTRKKASLVIGIGIWCLACLSALSLNILADWHPLTFNKTLENKNIMELLEYVSANGMTLVNSFLWAIFLGYVLNRKEVLSELGLTDGWLFKFWRLIVKVLVPIIIGYLLFDFLGLGFFE